MNTGTNTGHCEGGNCPTCGTFCVLLRGEGIFPKYVPYQSKGSSMQKPTLSGSVTLAAIALFYAILGFISPWGLFIAIAVSVGYPLLRWYAFPFAAYLWRRVTAYVRGAWAGLVLHIKTIIAHFPK